MVSFSFAYNNIKVFIIFDFLSFNVDISNFFIVLSYLFVNSKIIIINISVWHNSIASLNFSKDSFFYWFSLFSFYLFLSQEIFLQNIYLLILVSANIFLINFIK